ncbi:MAG: NEW3 domain-containing protein, partial [Desulfurococcaceae archaeon]
KRYANHNPPSWSGTVSGSNNLNPSYHVEYQLTINVSPSGAGTTSPAAGSYWYDSGSSVSVSATPNTGCTFSKWQLDGSDYSTNNPISVTMSSPHTLTAVFTGAMYALTVYVYRSGTSTAISGVTVKVDGASYTTDSSGRVSLSVSSGSHAVEVVSPYSPSSGTRYVFTQWSDGSTANPRTISVTTDTVLTAYMKLQYYLTMNVESGSGTVSPSSGWYDAGSSVFISASPSAGYAFDYWVGSGSGSYTGSSSSTTITISAPITQTAYFFSFSISISPNSGSCQQGGSISATVTVTYVSGYNSKTISLSASGLPSGASASFNPSSVTISPSTTTASSTMTTSTSTSTPTGTYTITITGTGGGITRTTTYSLTISTSTATVTFSVSGMGSDASGTVLTVDGTNYAYNQLPVSFTWDVGSTHSFTWTDYVSAGTGKRYAWTSTSGLSTSRSGSITVSPGGGSVSATYKTQYYLTMQASPSNGGSVSPSSGWYDVGYSVSISASPASGWAFERWIGSGSGSYSGTSSSSSVTMNAPITETAYFYTFSVSVSPTSGSTTPGGSVTATVTVTLTGGYSSSITVSFSASGLPSGASASFSPASVTISPSSPTATSTMTISTSTSTPTGTYSITVTASGGGLSKTTTYALTVSAAFDFSISASPSSLSICRGASKISTITVTLVSGSATTVSLSASSSPSGLSFSFSPSSGSPTFTSTLTITAPSGVSLGTYTVTVTGSGGGKTHSTTITVYVNDFSISVIPQSDSIYKGASKTATVLVTSTTGSASSMTVSLSASNVPSGVSVSFSSSSVTVGAGSSATSTMTVTVSTSASVGTYTITITGSSNCGTSKTTTYTLTINEPPVTVTFYAKFQKNGAYQNAWGSATVLNVDGNAYTAAQVGSGVSFTWAVGSQHYVSWYSGIYYDESSYLTGTDARYDWSYSSGIFTSQNGYLTVPSGGGTVTAYYSRTIEVIVSVNPSGGGSVSPSSGWYTEGTSFTATANSGYQFHHWVVKRGNSPETTSTSNPYYMYDPGYLTAVFYIRVLVYAWDSEYNLFRNSGVYISLQNIGGKYTNANGYAEFYVPPDYSGTLTASSTGTGYNSKSLPFWKWGDGVTSNPRTIYVYQPATYSAFYKCVLSFYKLAIIDNFPGAIWQPKATADGIVYVTTAKNAYGKNGITVQATFNYLIGSGSHTDTTHYGTINFFGTSITSDGTFHIEHWAGYGFQITSAEVKTLAGEGYVNAQITATTFPVRIG